MLSDSIFVNRSRGEESEWVIQICELLKKDELKTAIKCPASIFQLPDCIHDANPDAFAPHRIALGPYHHLRLQFYNMQPYKLHIAQKAKEELQIIDDFQQLRDRVAPLELRVRACYADHLNIDGETLIWMMLVDALFLLRFMQNRDCFEFLTSFNTHNARLAVASVRFQILSDVLKLENQIPIIVLKEILSSSRLGIQPESSFLFGFTRTVVPFYIFSPQENVDIIPAIFNQSHHLLHFMYLTILILPLATRPVPLSGEIPEGVTLLMKFLKTLGSVLGIDIIEQLSEAIDLIRELVKLLWMVKNLSSSQTTSHPLIPSASQLQKLHVQFRLMDSYVNKSNKGILEFEFKISDDSHTLFLPNFYINDSTETLLKNLVAFEAMANINPPVLARYLELMKALVHTPKDVKILKKKGILQRSIGYRISDEEVVKLFKRVGSSISTLKINKPGLENLGHLGSYRGKSNEGIYEQIAEQYRKGFQKTIEEINNYYGSFWRVKAKRFVKKYTICVLKIMLTFLVVSLIILVIVRLLIECLKPIIG